MKSPRVPLGLDWQLGHIARNMPSDDYLRRVDAMCKRAARQLGIHRGLVEPKTMEAAEPKPAPREKVSRAELDTALMERITQLPMGDHRLSVRALHTHAEQQL